jgi:hypothetical protein
MGSQSTFCRFFKQPGLEDNEAFMCSLYRKWFEMVDIVNSGHVAPLAGRFDGKELLVF